MSPRDEVRISFGFEAASDEPSINTVSIRCIRDGHEIDGWDCRDLASVTQALARIKQLDFETTQLEESWREIKEYLG